MTLPTPRPARVLLVRPMIDADGTTRWYRYGQLHREDGPAVENATGTKEWFCRGERHREDGPAVEYPDGTQSWWLNGKSYTKPAWLREVLRNRPLTTHQRDLLNALSENWFGTPDQLYATVCAWATFDSSGRDPAP